MEYSPGYIIDYDIRQVSIYLKGLKSYKVCFLIKMR